MGASPTNVGDAKMRIKFSIMAAVSSLTLAAVSTPALAGHCATGALNCNVGVNVIAPAPAQFGPMTVHTQHPMGHLRQVNFQRAPAAQMQARRLILTLHLRRLQLLLHLMWHLLLRLQFILHPHSRFVQSSAKAMTRPNLHRVNMVIIHLHLASFTPRHLLLIAHRTMRKPHLIQAV
jgi:hypothetical protein